jgi:FkbM family methyltransferase
MVVQQPRKLLRRYLAQPALQQPFRLLYRIALAGMNYGGASSEVSSGDDLALLRLKESRQGLRIVFDVGANIGSYVQKALRILGDESLIYAFEPSARAFSRLEQSYGEQQNVRLVAAGIGSQPGTATLWAADPGSVLGSIYANPIYENLPGEEIKVLTLDGYCEDHGIERIDLLKLDLEGGEFDALKGAKRLLEANAIGLIQFEFGQPSIGSRTFFADLFQLLSPRYDLYRVLPRGMECLHTYHETLEVFMSTNYLAVLRAE